MALTLGLNRKPLEKISHNSRNIFWRIYECVWMNVEQLIADGIYYNAGSLLMYCVVVDILNTCI